MDNACNAVAALSGPGLTQRRFLLDFPARAEAVNQMPLVGDLARLIGNDKISVDFYNQWRPVWETRLVECSQSPHCPPNLHKARKAYFFGLLRCPGTIRQFICCPLAHDGYLAADCAMFTRGGA